MKSDLRELGQRLCYTFNNPELLERAITHRSKSSRNYERLEFLGDSILEFVISAELYDRFPELSEGKLTRLRASLVKKDTLASLARDLALGDCLQLGSGELKSGGFDRDSILADSLEAILGAVYEDGGIGSAKELVLRLYHATFEGITPESIQKDPKTKLQEYLQQHSRSLPIYQTLEITGESHNQVFLVECQVPGLDEPVQGRGRSRRKAEQQAAAASLELLTRRYD